MNTGTWVAALFLQLVIWATMGGVVVYVIHLAFRLRRAFLALDESVEMAKRAVESQAETNRLLGQVVEALHAGPSAAAKP